ncbi:hypothetical protein LJPFL01_2020 [Lelliottia jeotgali]|nr:hypothetical protein LJPFL01_2020 [Lelliottia jeotgali]
MILPVAEIIIQVNMKSLIKSNMIAFSSGKERAAFGEILCCA